MQGEVICPCSRQGSSESKCWGWGGWWFTAAFMDSKSWMCICVSRCYHTPLQRNEIMEEGDLFLVHADIQKLTEGTDVGQ